MKLGLGLGLSTRTSAQITVVNDAIILSTGQSLQNHKFSQFSGAGDTAFQTETAIYFPGTVTHTDAAADNQYLTKSSYDASGDTGGRYYWDDTTGGGAKGTRYTAEIDPIANKETYNGIILDLGQSDGVNASMPHTKAQYKEKLQQFLTQLNSDFPNATIFINPLNRTRIGADHNARYNLVRQVQLELIDELAYVHRGVETYHRVMTDNFHFVEAGVEGQGEDEARRVAYDAGKISSGALGPYITNLVDKTDRIEFDIVHDGGTDWTAPTSGYGMFGVEDDGTSVVPSSITKTSATKGVIILPEGEAPLHGSTIEGFMNYGDGGDLAADPDVALDNATNPMPFRSAANIAVTNGDPIKDLDNLLWRIHARGSAKTYSSSNIVETITALGGESFSEYVAGEGPEFTDDYLRFARSTDRLLIDSDFSTGTTFTLGFCGKLPSSLPSFGVFGGFANPAGTSTNNARLYLDSSGRVNWQNHEAPSANGIISAALSANDDFIVFLRFNSASSLDGYINTTTPTNINPHDAFSVLERWAFGNATNQSGFVLGYRMYDAFMTSDAISNTELENIYDYWGDLFSLNFT